MTDEVRVVNDTTGGEKGSKLERFDLIPTGPLTALARHYGLGSRKYEDRNWERGYDWSLSFAAMQRHAWAFWGGEDLDPETGDSHLAAVAWHAFALMEWATTHPELDDRPNSGVELVVDIPRSLSWPGKSFDTTDPKERAEARAWLNDLMSKRVPA